MGAFFKFACAVVAPLLLFGCSVVPALQSAPGRYEVEHRRIKSESRDLQVTYVRPSERRPPAYCVVFVTGDGGWHGVSTDLFEHLAQQGYAIAGFSGREIVAPMRRSGQRIPRAVAAERLAGAFTRARRALGFADTTPMIVVGFSRGATIVAFAAVHPELHDGIAGAVAISLTREADYLRAAEGDDRTPGIELDSKGRIQIYPALKLFGATRVAVIESTSDRYVPAAEARELLGPDTATRRLFAVDAKNHRFRGGSEKLLHDVDAALEWIESAGAAKSTAAAGSDEGAEESAAAAASDEAAAESAAPASDDVRRY
ncbi:MAG TPA: AcvB/VirJ family lysyl-phosphatidylglycerol hydrolase [Gammaproteobacteria bacterium]|nr:AcvB/VirJ family lysyl-phosphatidylglycerol hydrolase [Gammaproteobacteria bacterium]